MAVNRVTTYGRFASTTIAFFNRSGVTNYAFSPIEATLGRNNNVQAQANQRLTAQSLLVNGGFNFDLPAGATVQSVKVRYHAQGNPLSTKIEIRDSAGTILETAASVGPNVQYTLTNSYTADQINGIQFGWYTQSDNMSYYASLDAMDIEVTFIDPRDMVQSAVDLYAASTLPSPHTNIASYAGGPTYLSEAKFLGPTDGVIAQIATANTSLWILGVQMDNLSLPDNARVDDVHFRLVTGTSIAGTLYVAPNTDFTTASFGAGGINNTSPWYKLNIPPSREELVGDNYMQMRFSNTSNRKAIDSFIMTVTYSVPAPTGPEVKQWTGSTWQSLTNPQRWNGSAWENLEITTY